MLTWLPKPDAAVGVYVVHEGHTFSRSRTPRGSTSGTQTQGFPTSACARRRETRSSERTPLFPSQQGRHPRHRGEPSASRDAGNR